MFSDTYMTSQTKESKPTSLSFVGHHTIRT